MPARRGLNILGSVGTYVLAGFGLIALSGVVIGWTLNMGFILFRTGSMEPTIPAGSLALVQEIEPAEISEGDILTVQTSEMEISVTHRVTAANDPHDVEAAMSSGFTDQQALDAGDDVVIRMQGDNNPVEDPTPYVVTEGDASVVHDHVPGAGRYVQMLAQREVQIGFAALMSTALAWAFWPRDEEDESDESHQEGQQPSASPRHARR